MGNKINPIAFRLGTVFNWTSRWFAAGPSYRQFLLSDVRLRQLLLKKLKAAGIARVEIERSINKVVVIVYVARPGVVIGRGGQGHEELKKIIAQELGAKDKKNLLKIDLRVEAVKEPHLDAYLVAVNVADQLLRQMPAKRVLRQEVEKVMTAGAKGVRIRLGGRINGAEIARVLSRQEGIVPLSSLREQVSFACFPALTKSGYVGVKVWLCKK